MAVKNTIPSQLHNPVSGRVVIQNSDGTSSKDILAIASGDNSLETFIYSLSITSTDTTARDLSFTIYDGINTTINGLVTVPSSAGSSVGNPPFQLIANRTTTVLARILKDANGNYFFPLRPGETLRVNALVAVAAGQQIVIHCTGWNFTRS